MALALPRKAKVSFGKDGIILQDKGQIERAVGIRHLFEAMGFDLAVKAFPMPCFDVNELKRRNEEARASLRYKE